jgi:hypothetical protein
MPAVLLNGSVKDSILDFFREVGGGIIGDKELKTKAIVMTVRAMIGTDPIVDRSNPAVNVIKFTKSQRLKLESYLDKNKKVDSAGKPANVKIDHTSLWMPYAIKKATPYLIGAGLIGFALGRFIK